jgi:hypothetical protein
MADIKPCETCGGNRWKTLKKGKKYQCRSMVRSMFGKGEIQVGCGNIRDVEQK